MLMPGYLAINCVLTCPYMYAFIYLIDNICLIPTATIAARGAGLGFSGLQCGDGFARSYLCG
jgi:hypothetical protein